MDRDRDRGSLCVLLSFLSQMSAVGITENAKGDYKKFEIWCNSRDEVFIVQVRIFYHAALTCRQR